MQRPFPLPLLLLSLALSAAHAAPAYQEYRVTVVGPANSAATDINQAGVVVGTYPISPTATHGFINRGKGMIDLGTLGGTSSNAVAINDKGQVLGNWTTRGGQQRGYIYYQGRQRDIGAVRGRHTTYTDINHAGYATLFAGTPYPYDDAGVRSFLRTPGGTLRDIGRLMSDENAPSITQAMALNNRNQVTGDSGLGTVPEPLSHAFTWSGGVMRDLGNFGLDIRNAGSAINGLGQITGYMGVTEGYWEKIAFFYSNGRLIRIDNRPGDETTDRQSSGTGINNHGHVVGTSDHLSGFIWRGRRMESLNALVDPRLGWDISNPRAINDAGQIAATATRGGVQYAVRLDLIRPHLLAAPDLEADAPAASDEQAAAEAQTEEEAQLREVVRPVRQ
ncbi:MAG TPA: HAF repeat-containing protein [Massilia sp.]|nr:HAF repeat-containing protein [Massilia sp.]